MSSDATTATAVPPEALPAVADAVAEPPVSLPDLITGRPMYATTAVNVRNAPGTEGTTIVGGLAPAQQVSAGSTVNGWIPVHAGADYGWVSADYLADGTPPAPPAVPEPAADGNWMTDLVGQVDPNGYATWVFSRNGGWGATDGHTVYIDPNVPSDKQFSVMVHEYSHVLQVRAYGSLRNSVAAMSVIEGNSTTDVSANESAADCMAEMLGATWVNYGCQDVLRPAASAVLVGRAA